MKHFDPSPIEASSSNPGLNSSESRVVELAVADNDTNNKHLASVELKDTVLPLENENDITNTTTTGTESPTDIPKIRDE